MTDAVDLLGCETVHDVSFGWYWDWGGIDGNSHSVAVNPFAAISADLPSVANVVSASLIPPMYSDFDLHILLFCYGVRYLTDGSDRKS